MLNDSYIQILSDLVFGIFANINAKFSSVGLPIQRMISIGHEIKYIDDVYPVKLTSDNGDIFIYISPSNETMITRDLLKALFNAGFVDSYLKQIGKEKINEIIQNTINLSR